MNQQKIEFDNLVIKIENTFQAKVASQFDDFILKVDGELSRRNRLRTETFNKFSEVDIML